MQTVATTEYGALYVDATGSFVFQDRALTTSSITLPTTDFNDDGTGISYVDANWVLNDVLVYNKATVTRTGGTAQVATNQASIDKYFLHSYNEQDLLMQTDAEALDYAQAYIASRQETSIRCDSIDLDLYTPNYSAGIVAALDLDFFDPITVTTTQPGGSTISKTLQIFGVQNFITPNSFKTTFTTLEPIIDGFIIGYGEIGIDSLSYDGEKMPTFPVVTGDIVTAQIWNGLPAYEISIKAGTTYTLATGDEYQKLLTFTSSSAKTVSIPTDATFDFPDGTAITILNDNATGDLTIQAASSGTTAVSSAGATSNAPKLTKFAACVCIKIATNDWVVVGGVS
jgi:hypothetical protein